jgi:hypothetical protein
MCWDCLHDMDAYDDEFERWAVIHHDDAA